MPLANGKLITLGGAVPGADLKDLAKQFEDALSRIAGCEISCVMFAINRSNGKIDMASGMTPEHTIKLCEMTAANLKSQGYGGSIIIPNGG